jgi:hypothetical protein
MRGCLVAFLVLLLVPFGFCAAVTHDNSVLLAPFVIVAPFFLLSLWLNRKGHKEDTKAEKEPADTPVDPVFRGIEKRVKDLQELQERFPRDD